MTRAILIAAALVLTACAGRPPAASTDGALIADGRGIAERHCAGCHAIAGGTSLRADAPAFSGLLGHYEGAVLEEEFIEGVKVGHPDMPNFQFEPEGAKALVAYIRSVQTER